MAAIERKFDQLEVESECWKIPEGRRLNREESCREVLVRNNPTASARPGCGKSDGNNPAMAYWD
jgi:hypothetical protein